MSRSASSALSRRQRGAAAVFIAPFLILFLATTIVPVGYAVWLSLYSEQSSGLGFGGTETVFVGLDNFVRALGSESFRGGFLTVGLYCAVYIPIMIGAALLLALLLDSAYARAKRFFQLALYLPNVIPGLIAATIWFYLYTPGLSPVVDAFESLGLGWDINSDGAALGAIANIAIWEHTGYNVIIFFAALQAIPREVIEAATVDGAGAVRTALRVKVPLIRGAVVLAVLFTVIGAMQLFTEPQIIRTESAAIGGEWTPAMFIYTAVTERHDYGQAAAASIIFAVVLGAASFVVTRFTSRRAA